jgi:aminoglycoside phosphotransferase (APT) family kinase protein
MKNIGSNLSNMIKKIPQDIKITEKIDNGYNSNTFFCKYNGEKSVLKYSNSKSEYESLTREYEICNILFNNSSIDVPKPIYKYEQNNNLLIIFSEVNTYIPNSLDWKNKQFCKDIIVSSAKVLNELHDNPKIHKKVNESEYCNQQKNKSRYLNKQLKRIRNFDMINEKKFEDSVSYILNNNYKTRFSHFDFTATNYSFHIGIEPIYDWQTCGYGDALYDISIFDSSVIDEFIYYFHSQEFVNELRDKFFELLNINIDMNRYTIYKYIHTSVILWNIANNRCTDLWLNIGTEQEIYNQTKNQLETLNKKVEKIINDA